jgi:hypothetical protein
MRLSEGFRFIRPEKDDDVVYLMATLPNWVGWHQAEKVGGNVRIPAKTISGERVVIEMSEGFIKDWCGAPNVEEYLAKKVRDYPPSVDNTYSWAKP